MDETVVDWLGRPLGIVKKEGDRTTVTSWTGDPLGSADNKGTRTWLGQPVSPNNVPDLLLPKK